MRLSLKPHQSPYHCVGCHPRTRIFLHLCLKMIDAPCLEYLHATVHARGLQDFFFELVSTTNSKNCVHLLNFICKYKLIELYYRYATIALFLITNIMFLPTLLVRPDLHMLHPCTLKSNRKFQSMCRKDPFQHIVKHRCTGLFWYLKV